MFPNPHINARTDWLPACPADAIEANSLKRLLFGTPLRILSFMFRSGASVVASLGDYVLVIVVGVNFYPPLLNIHCTSGCVTNPCGSVCLEWLDDEWIQFYTSHVSLLMFTILTNIIILYFISFAEEKSVVEWWVGGRFSWWMGGRFQDDSDGRDARLLPAMPVA